MSREVVTALICTVLASFSGCLCVGCQTLNPTPPIEGFVSQLMSDVVSPILQEGIAEGVNTMSVHWGAQGINPTYVIEFEGKIVQGLETRASVGVEGIAGQVQSSAAGGGP